MNKPRLLLLPGLLNDARLWERQVSGLTGTVQASVADLTTADTIPALAASALARAPAERFALAGLSMGGYVALEMMRQAPERILGLALLDTSARPDTREATESRRKLMRLSESDFPAVIEAMMPSLLHPDHLKDAGMTETFRAMARSMGQYAFLRQQAAILSRIDSRPWLRRILCPTLVLCGREDAVTPMEVHEEMAAGIPGSRLEIVEKCGHLSALEQPDRVTEALKKWVSGAPEP